MVNVRGVGGNYSMIPLQYVSIQIICPIYVQFRIGNNCNVLNSALFYRIEYYSCGGCKESWWELFHNTIIICKFVVHIEFKICSV